MTVTVSSSLAGQSGAASSTIQITLASVPAGGAILLGIQDRSDETTTISGISDTVNGAWALNYVSGPVDAGSTTNRSWLAYRLNCAAGSPVITVTFSGAINCQLCAGWISSDQGAMTFDAAATPSDHSAATAINSNTAAATGAGAIIGVFSGNSTQGDPEPTANGSGESRITSAFGGGRTFMFYEAYGSAGSYGFEITCDATSGNFLVGAFLEPAAGAALRGRNVFRSPMFNSRSVS